MIEGQVMVATYDPILVALSVFISILAAYAARALTERMSVSRRRIWLTWLVFGALVDGIGTWSMHYTGMLALHLPVPVAYDWPMVLLSYLIGVIGSAGSLFFLSHRSVGPSRALVGSIVLGTVGISGLHYTAMAAMRFQAMDSHSLVLVTLAVVLAIAFSLASLGLTFLFQGDSHRRHVRNHGSVVLRGLANPAMHYTAMAAVTYMYFTEPPDLSHAVSISSLGFLGISIVPAMVVVVGLLTSLVDRHQKQRALLDELFEQAPQGVVLMTMDNRVVRVNREFTRIFGYSPPEILGKRLNELIVPDEAREEDQRHADMVAHGQRVDVETVRQRKDGSRLQVSMVGVPVSVPGGQVEVYAIFRDISIRKRAEEALRQYTARLEAQHEIDTAILAARSLGEIAEGILHRIINLVPCERVGITFLDFDAHELIWLAVHATGTTRIVPGQRLPFEDNLGGIDNLLAVLQKGEVVLVDDIATLPRSPLVRTALAEGWQSLMSAPLRAQGNLIGALNLWANQPARFSTDDADTIRTIADSLAVAIAQVRLFEEVSTSRDRLRILSQRLVETEESERRRLARELHDQVGQKLSALGINLSVLRSRLPVRTARKVEARLNDSIRLLEEMVQRIDDVTAELHPAVLDDFGLDAALRWYTEQFSNRTGLMVTVQGGDSIPRLPPEAEIALFRITQEALTNVAKHAYATHVTITAESLDGSVRLTIADNGRGFDVSRPRQPGERHGLGLLSMRERAEAVAGRLRIEAAPGNGTRVVVEIPR